MTVENAELGLTGKGVEAASIPALDKLVKQYILDKEKAEEAARHEEEAADKLMDAMHEHAEKLIQPDGTLIYKCGVSVVSVVTGNEKLKVKTVAGKKNDDEATVRS